MRVGDIVVWSAPGCEPETGVVLKLTDKRAWLKNPRYAFERNLSDGVFTMIPSDDDFVKDVSESMKETVMATAKKTVAKKAKAAPAKAKKKVGKTGDGPSKMDLAMDIVRKAPNLTRAQAIAKFTDEAKLTKAGAATYWSLVNRKLKKEKAAK